MKLLLDMNAPPSMTGVLAPAGHDVVHWSTIGAATAPDSEVLGWAAANGYVLVTHDLDFGALLASGALAAPSVVQIRTLDLRPDQYSPRLLAVLEQERVALGAGALISVDETTSRVRILPLSPSPRPK